MVQDAVALHKIHVVLQRAVLHRACQIGTHQYLETVDTTNSLIVAVGVGVAVNLQEPCTYQLGPVKRAYDNIAWYCKTVELEGVDNLSELVVLLRRLIAVEVSLTFRDVALQVQNLVLQLLQFLLTLRLVTVEQFLRALHSGNLLLQLGTLQQVGVTTEHGPRRGYGR